MDVCGRLLVPSLWSFFGSLPVCVHLLVVISCMLVIFVRLLVVCGRLLVVYGRLLVVCSRFVTLSVVILVVPRYIFLMLQLLSSPITSFLSMRSPKAQVQVFVVIKIDT